MAVSKLASFFVIAGSLVVVRAHAYPHEDREPATARSHWSFEVPAAHPLPQLRDKDWSRVKHDAFIEERLEREGLTHARPEDPARLLRRAAIDLTGLPPSHEDIAAFVATPMGVADAAYAAAVDRFLASPAYGERFARVWLDLFRHADTKGYEKDLRRPIWPFRDWLIRALNADRSLPQFTEAMLAGDLLPSPTEDDILATAMNRETMENDEGGTDDEEFRIAAVKDRTDTTMQVFMGLTFGCAKCHSHKYDPISQTEYYQTLAFFDQSEDADRFDDAPTVPYSGEGAKGAPVQVPVMRELAGDKRRTTQVHLRGNFLDKGAVVTPATPAFLPAMEKDEPRNRLGLAHWITSRDNPLTARVLVNRIWAQFFGRGIVETEEDFGTQGTNPSHPELLDDLAVRFVENGQSMKWLCREIALSATYRQSSIASDEALSKDPDNRLLSHGPRVRLDAEMVRDQALAVAGLLSARMYGPPVMPRQPDGIWAVVYSDDQWRTSPGGDAHRRSVYTFIRRTSAYPALLTFDAPTREKCTVRRVTTNTPLQALVTLNDPVFVECAQGLARRVFGEGGATEAIAARMFRYATAREPTGEESALLTSLYEGRVAYYATDLAAAAQMAEEPLGRLENRANAPQLAAWTNVANVVLNLDEVLTR